MDDDIFTMANVAHGNFCDDFAPNRGVLRTLEVLKALNARGGTTVVEISRTTGISRGALYRLLETLREAGYVSVDFSGRRYSLTRLVRSLAEGFTEEEWVIEVARPALKKLQKLLLWPVDLGTFSENSIVMRETTRSFSRLTIDRFTIGTRGSLLESAAGRCYLAHCPIAERELIIRNIVAAQEPGWDIALNRQSLDRLLSETRERGYGMRFGEPPAESGAIAVPIMVGEQVLGCIIVTFIRRVLTVEESVRVCLGPMMQTAADIADGVRRSS